MTHTFPYRDVPQVAVPDGQLVGRFAMAATPGAGVTSGTPQERVAAALQHPVGSVPLRDQVMPGMNVVVVADDITRTTRTDVILPAVLSELVAAGIVAEAITIFVAIGTHRTMTTAELSARFGRATVERFRVVQPNAGNPDEFDEIAGRHGFTARVHRCVLAADYVIGIGQVAPHLIAGYGGGCKIINPGCSDRETIGNMH
jgi:nickel-dependent lactate racemase